MKSTSQHSPHRTPYHFAGRSRFSFLNAALLLSAAFISVAGISSAQPATPAGSGSAAGSTRATTTAVSAAPKAAIAVADANAITININGSVVETDPAPLLKSGSVLVPLRGVLEKLGAKVNYEAAAARIDIVQNGRRYSLKVGQDTAIVENTVVRLASAPVSIGGRAFVPLRSLAELFGYKVSWVAASRIVAINSAVVQATVPAPNVASVPVEVSAERKAALKAAGRYGVNINFHDVPMDDIEPLLDAAKKAGANLVKFRFDWNALEPTQGSAFQWPLYDRVVKGARTRGLTVVGVLGNTTRWATLYPRSQIVSEWRNSPPKPSELPAWENYVRRVVGRYGKDVAAWQVWENPASSNFRSVAKDYRIVTKRALDAARVSDPQAILFAAEPGGINLGFMEELRRNGLAQQVAGISLYPVSQWQPGVVAQPEEMVLPITTLLRDPLNRDKEYWVNGLSRLSLEATDLQPGNTEKVFRAKDAAVRLDLVKRFTPNAQADYLVKSSTLALAAGINKVFWGALRDEPEYGRVDPVNSFYGGGLLRADNTPRPSLAAFSTLTRLVGNKSFIGALSAGPRMVVLIFEGGGEITGVAWAEPGQEKDAPKLVLDPTLDPGTPGAIYIQTNDASRVLDATGKEVGGASGTIELSTRPVWITNISNFVAQSVRDRSPLGAFRLVSTDKSPEGLTTLQAVFAPGAEGREQGLYWRKYLGFRGAANDFATVEGQAGLKTTFSRDIYNPAAGLPNIYLDVANDFLFFAKGAPVVLKVEVKRTPKTEGAFASRAGFNIQYDSPTGFRMTKWNIVEEGEGWQTVTIKIPNASFANRDGFDMLINTWGSKQDLVFRSLTLEKATPRVASEPLPEPGRKMNRLETP